MSGDPLYYDLPAPLADAITGWEAGGAQHVDLRRAQGLPCGHTLSDPIAHLSTERGPLQIVVVLVSCCVCRRQYWDGTLNVPTEVEA